MINNFSEHSLPIYRDKWLQIFGIPIITIFGYYLTYNNIQLNWLLIYELISDGFKIFIVWKVIRWIIVWLDVRYSWSRDLPKRLALQVLLTCLGGMLTLTLLVHLEYYFIRPYQLEHFFSLDLVIALIFMLLLNVIYVSLYYYDLYLGSQAEKQALTQKMEERNRRVSDHFIIKVGKRNVIIPFGQILCFYSQEKETFLFTSDHKTYLVDYSLEKIEEELPENDFFRANRKFIITPSLIESIHTENHGKLLIHLKPFQKLPVSLTISREKAPAFRKWMKQ